MEKSSTNSVDRMVYLNKTQLLTHLTIMELLKESTKIP